MRPKSRSSGQRRERQHGDAGDGGHGRHDEGPTGAGPGYVDGLLGLEAPLALLDEPQEDQRGELRAGGDHQRPADGGHRAQLEVERKRHQRGRPHRDQHRHQGQQGSDRPSGAGRRGRGRRTGWTDRSAPPGWLRGCRAGPPRPRPGPTAWPRCPRAGRSPPGAGATTSARWSSELGAAWKIMLNAVASGLTVDTWMSSGATSYAAWTSSPVGATSLAPGTIEQPADRGLDARRGEEVVGVLGQGVVLEVVGELGELVGEDVVGSGRTPRARWSCPPAPRPLGCPGSCRTPG